MARDVINKIKDNFENIYKEMQTIAIKRYKNHQILIAKEVKYYIQKIKLENSENISSEEASSDDDGIESLNESLDSNELNDNFTRAIEK